MQNYILWYYLPVKFGALWIGKPTKIEQMVWSSFIYHGHSLTVFVYDDSIEVPEGVVKADANKIVPNKKIFLSPGPKGGNESISAFADYFRYTMMYKTGLAWTDSDALCMSKFFTDQEYFFAYDRSAGFVANGTMVMPQKSDLLKYLIDRSKETLAKDTSQLPWATLGPRLLTEAVNKFNLESYVAPTEYLHPVPFNNLEILFSPRMNRKVVELSKRSASVHLWNSLLLAKNINKESFPKNSFIYTQAKKYGIV